MLRYIPRVDDGQYRIHLSYNDILLVPYDDDPCTIESRSDPDIGTSIGAEYVLNVPIISAPMDSITGIEMAVAMDKCGGLGIYTRHINDELEEEKQCCAIKSIRESIGSGNVACAIGVKCDITKRAQALINHGANIICLDIANGNHVFMIKAIRELRVLKDKCNYPICIIAGNVATPKAAKRLSDAGADAIKVGIGPGGACTTRRVTGFGVPQLTAVMQCAEALYGSGTHIIADGGIRHSGDAVKALWAGADAVMMGYALSGHNECPQVSNVPKVPVDVPKRVYRGMSSRTVSSRFDIAAEGVSFEVPARGPVKDTLTEYAAAIKSACSYANAMNLEELRKNVYAIRVSTMSQTESDPIAGE